MRTNTVNHESLRNATGAPRARLSISLTLAAMSLGYGVVQLDVTIVNTALSSIGSALGGGVTELQWVVSAYTIAFAALILSTGALGDRLGARRVFMWGFVLFTAASLGCALAPTAMLLIAARAIQGVGASAQPSEAAVNRMNPHMKTRRAPSRSPSAPADRISAANAIV